MKGSPLGLRKPALFRGLYEQTTQQDEKCPADPVVDTGILWDFVGFVFFLVVVAELMCFYHFFETCFASVKKAFKDPLMMMMGDFFL